MVRPNEEGIVEEFAELDPKTFKRTVVTSVMQTKPMATRREGVYNTQGGGVEEGACFCGLGSMNMEDDRRDVEMGVAQGLDVGWDFLTSELEPNVERDAIRVAVTPSGQSRALFVGD